MFYSKLVKIIVAEHQKLVKEGIINLLNSFPNLLVIDEAENGRELIEKFVNSSPDLIITDMDMVPISGVDAIADIIKLDSNIKVLFLSSSPTDVQLRKLFSVGCFSIVSKLIGINELVYAISVIMSGENYFGKEYSEYSIESQIKFDSTNDIGKKQLTDFIENLSDREEEVLSLLASGLTSKAIANKLFLSRRTIDTHRMHISQKFNLKGSAELLQFAFNYFNSIESKKLND